MLLKYLEKNIKIDILDVSNRLMKFLEEKLQLIFVKIFLIKIILKFFQPNVSKILDKKKNSSCK